MNFAHVGSSNESNEKPKTATEEINNYNNKSLSGFTNFVHVGSPTEATGVVCVAGGGEGYV